MADNVVLLKDVLHASMGNGWSIFQTADGLYSCGDISWGACGHDYNVWFDCNGILFNTSMICREMRRNFPFRRRSISITKSRHCELGSTTQSFWPRLVTCTLVVIIATTYGFFFLSAFASYSLIGARYWCNYWVLYPHVYEGTTSLMFSLSHLFLSYLFIRFPNCLMLRASNVDRTAQSLKQQMVPNFWLDCTLSHP